MEFPAGDGLGHPTKDNEWWVLFVGGVGGWMDEEGSSSCDVTDLIVNG